MSNPFDGIRAAVSEARALNRAVAEQANALVDLIQPHLESVTHMRLKDLKRQLEAYNAHTGRWRSRK